MGLGIGSLGGVNELPPSSRYVARASEPVTDADRSEINARLNDAFSAGRLDEVAYQRQLDALYAATTLGELAPVVSGLPTRPTYDTPSIVDVGAAPPPGELTPHRSMSPALIGGLIGGGAVVVLLLLLILVIFI